MRIKKFPCPSCGEPTQIAGAREISSMMRRSYAYCKNPFCGASWQLNIEVSAAASQASGLFSGKVPRTRALDVDEALPDIALDYMQRHKIEGSRDELMDSCAAYLKRMNPAICSTRARLVAARAVAEYESRHFDCWRVDADQSVATSIIVTQQVSTPVAQKREHMISLRELVDLIEARIKAEQDGRLL